MMYVGSCTMVFIHLGNDRNELDGGQVKRHGGYKHGVNGMGSGGLGRIGTGNAMREVSCMDIERRGYEYDGGINSW